MCPEVSHSPGTWTCRDGPPALQASVSAEGDGQRAVLLQATQALRDRPLPHHEVSAWVREVLGLIKEERDRTPGGLQDAARQVAGPAGAREQAKAAFGNSAALS